MERLSSHSGSQSDGLVAMTRMAFVLILAIAISSCSDKSVSDRLVFEKEYIIKNADQKLAVRVFASDFIRLPNGTIVVDSSMSMSEAMLHFRNAGTSKIKCLAEVVGSCPLRGTPDIIENLRITFRNDYSEGGDSNMATEANLLKGEEIITLNKVGIIEIEANEEIQIPIGTWPRGREYRIRVKWQ